MKKTVKVGSSTPTRKSRPALTPEARENQLIAMAMNEAEEQLRNHTASSQVITHFLKLGTAKAQLELEKIRRENKVLERKAESLESSQRIEQLYTNAIKAMRKYSGYSSEEEDDYDDEF